MADDWPTPEQQAREREILVKLFMRAMHERDDTNLLDPTDPEVKAVAEELKASLARGLAKALGEEPPDKRTALTVNVTAIMAETFFRRLTGLSIKIKPKFNPPIIGTMIDCTTTAVVLDHNIGPVRGTTTIAYNMIEGVTI